MQNSASFDGRRLHSAPPHADGYNNPVNLRLAPSALAEGGRRGGQPSPRLEPKPHVTAAMEPELLSTMEPKLDVHAVFAYCRRPS
jgi:hypothetical protein